MAKVLISCPPAVATVDQYLARLTDAGLEVVLAEVAQQLSEPELLQVIGEVDGMIAGDDPLTARVLEQARRLRVIVRWGIGMDNVDLAAANLLGIRVVNTPGMFADEVADIAIGYLIMLARQLHRVDAEVRAGQWPKPQGRSLAGCRLAIIGLGWIGRAVARRAQAMGMVVLGHDVAAGARDAAAAEGVAIVPLDELVTNCDALVLCTALTADNRHLINSLRLASMRPGGWLINVSRGGLVDQRALEAALRSGALAGAALDVYEQEPLPADSPLRTFDQVILGSHNASNTREAVSRVNAMAVGLLLQGLNEVTR